ncbi:alpha-rep [Gossypium mustelinum symptomless alphasatellite [Gossypium latifolium]]|nr:alpha-rep [Gossypium mustelinum symptomless alphasatellite [Gossypium latifolium]]
MSVFRCFTIFFPSSSFPGLIPLFENSCVSYPCWQEEESPTTRRRHLQGYLQCKGQRTLKQVKTLFGDLNPHLEKQRARKTDEARDYCMKEETRVSGPYEFGNYVAGGSNKRKLDDLLGNSDNEIEEPQKYRRAMAAIEFTSDWPHGDEDDEDVISVGPRKPFSICIKGMAGASVCCFEFESRCPHYFLGLWSHWWGRKVPVCQVSGFKQKLALFTWGQGYCYDVHVLYEAPEYFSYRLSSVYYDFINYAFLEMVKNRTVYSYKYEPVGFIDPTCNVHVVVMANFLPDYERISQDRIKLIDLS